MRKRQGAAQDDIHKTERDSVLGKELGERPQRGTRDHVGGDGHGDCKDDARVSGCQHARPLSGTKVTKLQDPQAQELALP